MNDIDYSPNARDMLQMLMRLRRKGASLVRRGALPDSEWTIVLPGRARRQPTDDVTAAPHIVTYAREQGWLAGDGDPNRLRLTEAGALKLTRGLDLAPQPAAREPTVRANRPTTSRHAPARAAEEAPVAILRLRRQRDAQGNPLLSGAAGEAAERLAADFAKGRMQPRVTADWDKAMLGERPQGMAPGLGIELRDGIADAQERVRRALDVVGNDHAGVLIDVCCLDRGLEDVEAARGWPRGAGRVVLAIALGMLAAHYGIVATGPARGQLGRWGSGDDKPTLDAWR